MRLRLLNQPTCCSLDQWKGVTVDALLFVTPHSVILFVSEMSDYRWDSCGVRCERYGIHIAVYGMTEKVHGIVCVGVDAICSYV